MTVCIIPAQDTGGLIIILLPARVLGGDANHTIQIFMKYGYRGFNPFWNTLSYVRQSKRVKKWFPSALLGWPKCRLKGERRSSISRRLPLQTEKCQFFIAWTASTPRSPQTVANIYTAVEVSTFTQFLHLKTLKFFVLASKSLSVSV